MASAESNTHEIVLMCDFDGTITQRDVGIEILERFSRVDWQLIERDFEQGLVNIQDNMQAQFAHIPDTEEVLLEYLRPVVTLREGWPELVGFCAMHGIEVVVVSGGLDFYVRELLPRTDPMPEVYCLSTEYTDNGWRISLPEGMDEGESGFKESVIERYRARGKKVWFIGNGTSDRGAASEADKVWAVEPLLSFCKSAGIQAREFETFLDIRDDLHDMVGMAASERQIS